MIQYMRLKQMKETGKKIREYLSMSDGLIPIIFCKFFLHSTCGGGGGARGGNGIGGGGEKADSGNKAMARSAAVSL